MLALPSPAQTTAPAPVSLAPYGIELTGPPGWIWQWGRPTGVIARWNAPPKSDQAHPPYFQITAAPVGVISDRELAQIQALAPPQGTTQEIRLDGQPAWQCNQPGFVGIYCTHTGVRYTIAYEALPIDLDLLENFCAGLRFTAIQPCSNDLALHPQRIRVFDHSTMRLPAWVRWGNDDPSAPRGAASFIQSTFLDAKPSESFIFAIEMPEVPEGSFAQWRSLEAQVLIATTGFTGEPKFKALAGKDRAISEPVAGKKDQWIVQRALITTGPTTRLRIHFQYQAPDALSRAAFASLAESIAASIKPATAKPAKKK